MKERREIRRRRLVQHLEVYDRSSGRYLGRVVDISPKGLLIISEQAVTLEAPLELRLDLPEAMFGRDHVDLDAITVWRKKDANPGYWDLGISFSKISGRDQEIIRQLISAHGLIG
jgi:c-di-GMP-binding flagellar brake protein YcgR